MSAANYTNAKRILKNSAAKISQSPEGIFDQNAVVLFWDAIEPRFINECVNYLNDLNEEPVLAGPTQFYDTLFEESLYHLHAYYDEDADRPDPNTRQQRIYRIMMRNPVTYSADNWGEVSTRWKLENGSTATGGPSSLLTLSMANVTVEDALSFELQEFISDTFTDEIYLLRGIPLQGTWFSIRRRSEVNPKTGLYTLYWFLTNSDADTLYFRVHTGPNEVRGYFYERDATKETLDTLMRRTLFGGALVKLPSGEVLISPGQLIPTAEVSEELISFSGINISDLMGKVFAFSEWGVDSIKLISTDGTLTIFKQSGVWRIATVSDGTVLYKQPYDSAIPSTTVGWETAAGAGIITSMLERWGGVATTLRDRAVGRTVINRSTRRDEEDRMWDTDIEIVWVSGSSEAVQASRLVTFAGANIDRDSTDALCMKHDGTLVVWAAFKSYISAYRGSVSTKENADGTIDYSGAMYLDADEAVTLAYFESSSVFTIKYNWYGLNSSEVSALADLIVTPSGLVIGD